MKKIISFHTVLFASLLLTTLTFSQTSKAYLALHETAELLPENYFKLGVAPEITLSDRTGIDVGVYFDTYLTEDTNARFTLGGGKYVDFWTSASLKWVPIPDVDRQPAMGLRGAVLYSRHESVNFYSFQVSPIVSKLADTTIGKMIPFVGLPITFTNSSNENVEKSKTQTQFAIGAEWFSNKDMHVGGEFDLNLNNSYTAVSAFISFPFDQAVGYKK